MDRKRTGNEQARRVDRLRKPDPSGGNSAVAHLR